jgi:predicted regulator of Ras-like GTPase activity (Roadblock/LC7/MglB family)
VPVQIGETVHLPLNDILDQLPATVSPLVLTRTGGSFSLPTRSAIEQLGTGAVKVRFGELRRSAFPGTFANDSTRDEILIELPLPQVLAAIGPAAFARRAQQKATAVPDEVTGVFGPKGTVLPTLTPKPATAVPPATPMIIPAPPTPKPAPSFKPVSSQPVTIPAPPLPFSTRPTPAPPPSVPIPALTKPAVNAETVATTIGAICQSWPDAIRQEIEQSGLGEAPVLIPMSRLEAGMKAGRVVFAWSELLVWLNVPASAPSSQGAVELELPLGVIAPLFIGKHRAATQQKKVAIGQNIPDLFAGLTKSAATAPAAAPAPFVAAPVAAAPATAPAAKHSALGELFGQPTKEEWTPQEIAREIAALPGVSGSLLATSDGLLVAGQVPPPLEAETLAAFLPQIFGRMSDCAEEVKLGALRAVTVSTDSAPCAMFKAGKLHLAVVGKAGQSLPDATLLRIATEVAKLNQ